MIFNDVFSNVFGNVPAGDEDNIVKVAVGAVRAGWAVVVDKPGSKAPMCILTARQAKQADKLARQGAEAAGDPSYARRRHACGLHHALTDDAQARRVVTRLVKDNGPVNLGLELGRSRLVVVDVDTAQEHSAFIRMWEDATGTDTGMDSPTVLSPGAQDKDGQWVHKDGGHYWFTLPAGIELPQGMGVLKGEGGWSVMWRDKQVLVPPSSRPEGTYRLVGQPRPLPEWLHAFIVEQASQRLTQRSESVKRALGSDSSIDRWAATAAWGDLLEPDGWTDTGLIDNCGCPVWTAPGTHASPKSATAHDHGCDRYDTIGGHAPLHVWTDNPPEWVADALSAKGTNTITKLTYLAYRFHGGDNKVAVRELGIGADDDDPFFGSSGSTTDVPSSSKSSPAADPTDDEEDLSEDDDDGEDEDPDEDDEEPEQSWRPQNLDAILDGSYEAPQPTVGARADGTGLFYPGRMHSIVGESEGGKTWFALMAILHEIRQGNGCMFVDFEDDAPGVVGRLLAMGATPAQIRGHFAYIRPESGVQIMENRKMFFQALGDLRPVLVAVDGVTEGMSMHGLELKDNTDVAKFSRWLLRPAAKQGAAVTTLDHVVKDKESRGRYAIGGVHKLNGLNGAMYVLENRQPFGIGVTGISTVRLAKDRPGQLRRHGLPHSSGMHWFGDLSLVSRDETDGRVTLSVPVDGAAADRPTGLMHKLSDILQRSGTALSKNEIEDRAGANRMEVRRALAALVDGEYVDVEDGPRGARLHRLVQSFNSHETDPFD